ncbi:hypothetical protein D6856_02605 [Butyrivibrio sp. XB500-5]|uniref:hypothetical protein n=1 Tax=Butyrivibrio sp. XB500-5 TaxID=2364880 RepID=UPI000EA8AB83|nr:hypothetical protein [Butyrivibrio sp. XB500-5]RKM63031.1 hypothetical protein D6856_02605 [Butyrivibrio sp. XB500-5]
MSNERKLKEGAATFYIYDKELHHKDDDPFIVWLKSEGFKAEYFGHGNVDNAIYVNINSKVYTWGMAGVSLSAVVGNHAIHIDEFKKIYEIFKKYSGFTFSIYTEEDQRAYDDYMAQIPILKEQAEKSRKEYFSKNPTYEEWCHDVACKIMEDEWYSQYTSMEKIYDDMKDKFIESELRFDFSEKKLPAEIACEWWIITF